MLSSASPETRPYPETVVVQLIETTGEWSSHFLIEPAVARIYGRSNLPEHYSKIWSKQSFNRVAISVSAGLAMAMARSR